MPADHEEQPDELSSWKEIAFYLGVSIRAAQKWERDRGLPVKRLPGARSVVSARRDRLDAWRNAGTSLAPVPPFRRRGITWLAILALVFAAAGILAIRAPRKAPASFRVDDGSLVVMNDRGGTLWRKGFDEPLIPSEYNPGTNNYHRRFWAGDLDSDGRTEVLFVRRPSTPAGSCYLQCYSDTGAERWRFNPGRTVSSGFETFEDRYCVEDFVVAPWAKDGAQQIIVTSVHVPFYPSQVAVLAADGKTLSEYWHSGWLSYLAVSGRTLYLGGVSNAYRAATLVVLDADEIGGASVEPDRRYQLQNLGRAHERFRALFPRTCINRLFEPYNHVRELFVDDSGVHVVVVERRPPANSSVRYDFTPNLKLASVTLDDRVRYYHAELRARGELNHSFTAAEEAEMGSVRIVSEIQP